jgi:hypothetical protein
MSQPSSDLPRFVQIIGRYRALVGIMAALGLLGAAVFAVLNPTVFTSRALVQMTTPSCPVGAICGGPAFSPGYIGARLLQSLPGDAQIKPTGNVLWVTTTARTAARAEATAESAARRYLSYADSLSYLGEHASAQILEPATSATGTTPLRRLLDDLLLGAVFGALLGFIAALGGSGATIDTLPAPPAVGVSEEQQRMRQETQYESAGPTLQQLARDYVQRTTPMAPNA